MGNACRPLHNAAQQEAPFGTISSRQDPSASSIPGIGAPCVIYVGSSPAQKDGGVIDNHIHEESCPLTNDLFCYGRRTGPQAYDCNVCETGEVPEVPAAVLLASLCERRGTVRTPQRAIQHASDDDCLQDVGKGAHVFDETDVTKAARAYGGHSKREENDCAWDDFNHNLGSRHAVLHALPRTPQSPTLTEGRFDLQVPVALHQHHAACFKKADPGNVTRSGFQVRVNLYDLSDSFAGLNALGIDLLGLGGALHVGVEVLGAEWSFGMGGVSVTSPRQNHYYSYRQTLSMGCTSLLRNEVEGVTHGMKAYWLGKDYDIFVNNCGTFCNSLLVRLGVGSMPPWVTRLAETMARLPAARALADAVAKASVQGVEELDNSAARPCDDRALDMLSPDSPAQYRLESSPILGTHDTCSSCGVHTDEPSDGSEVVCLACGSDAEVCARDSARACSDSLGDGGVGRSHLLPQRKSKAFRVSGHDEAGIHHTNRSDWWRNRREYMPKCHDAFRISGKMSDVNDGVFRLGPPPPLPQPILPSTTDLRTRAECESNFDGHALDVFHVEWGFPSEGHHTVGGRAKECEGHPGTGGRHIVPRLSSAHQLRYAGG